MKKEIFLSVLIALLVLTESKSQTTTIIDSLDNPIAMIFVEDDIYVAIHGGLVYEGQLIKFNVNDPLNTYEILLDSLIYPRALIEVDSTIYVGLRDEILSFDLNDQNIKLDTVIHESLLFPRSFEINGNDLLIAQDKALSKLDLSSEVKEKEVLYNFENSPLSIKNYKNSLIIAEGNSIYRYDYSSNSLSVIIEGLDYTTYSILIVDNSLYLDQSDLTFGEEEIVVYDLNNINDGPMSYCSNLGSVISLTEHKRQIYFASQKFVVGELYEGEIQVLDKKLVSLQNQADLDFKCYPNPTVDVVYFDYKFPVNVKLFNMNGEMVKKEFLINKINVSELPSGFYEAVISDNNSIYLTTRKIIKY